MIYPHWYVWYENINTKKITKYDIFAHGSFRKDVYKAWEEHKNDRKEFMQCLRRSLQYYFWGKSEWETMITSLFTSGEYPSQKIDVYMQVDVNWVGFSEYVWNTLSSADVEKEKRRADKCLD